MSGWWTALLARPARISPASQPLAALHRADLVWAASTAAISALLFATTISSSPGLGDAPESVAGVMSLGVLHAPGYPAYVLLARAFTLLVPFGSAAFRVNLFSLVCASLTVGGVQLLGRRCGASRWAASLGALSLAATAGFWFYADFAKHDVFSTLLFLAGLHLALSWRRRPVNVKLIALAVVIGLGLGSSWPLETLLLPTLAYVLIIGRRRISLIGSVRALAAGLAVVLVVYGFVMVRASEQPAVNWGDATTLSKLAALVRRSDFTVTSHPAAGATPVAAIGTASARAGGAGTSARGSEPAIVPASVHADGIARYGVIFARELGILGALLAALGLLACLRRRSEASFPLALTFGFNLLGAAAAAGLGATDIDTELTVAGFVFGCYIVLACLLALGATELGRVVSRAPLWRDRLQRRQILGAGAAVALGALILVPLVVSHQAAARQASHPLADRYATTVFAELPRDAVVFYWGAELTQPLIYRQVVFDQRRDVLVIAADGLSFPWYRQEVQRRLGRTLPQPTADPRRDAADLINALIGSRPVYLDPQATEILQRDVRFVPTGLLARAIDGKPAGLVAPTSVDQLQQILLAAERSSGIPDPLWNQWPNTYLDSAEYVTAALRVGRLQYARRNLVGMRSAFLNVLKIDPSNQSARSDLAALGNQGRTP